MVKTGARVNVLRVVLRDLVRVELARKPLAPRILTLVAATAGSVMDLYRERGGIQDAPKLAPGGYDVACADGLLLVLDEDMHFHRPRATFGTPWADVLPWTAPATPPIGGGGTGSKR